jgi:hypothetical protein
MRLGLAVVAVTVGLAGGAAAQRPAVRSYAIPLPPTITTSTEVPDLLAAQTKLSRFITALQTGRRVRAASMLSARVTEAERQGLINKVWLRYDPKDRTNVRQVLYWRDLQIHTQRVMRDAVDLAVVSRSIALKPKVNGKPSGILEVRMRKEQGEWRVDLHPVRVRRK